MRPNWTPRVGMTVRVTNGPWAGVLGTIETVERYDVIVLLRTAAGAVRWRCARDYVTIGCDHRNGQPVVDPQEQQRWESVTPPGRGTGRR